MASYADIVAVRDALYEADAITMKGVRILNQFPTISPDEVRGVGDWLTGNDNPRTYGRIRAMCGRCGQFALYDFVNVGSFSEKLSRYCPNCGARMKGAEDGTTDMER